MILQGKGGVGKSMIASLLAQYQKSKGIPLICVDTDPINQTFLGYQGLNVEHLQIMHDDEIYSRLFDKLIELIFCSQGKDIIIDNGASSFVPLSYYLITNRVVSLLTSEGYSLIVHTVITGGQALLDTINGCFQLITQFPKETFFIVWLNRFWGEIEEDGKVFKEMKAYSLMQDRISGIICIPKFKMETYGRDFSFLLQQKKTFDEALQDPSFSVMVRQRLKIMKELIFKELEHIALLS